MFEGEFSEAEPCSTKQASPEAERFFPVCHSARAARVLFVTQLATAACDKDRGNHL